MKKTMADRISDLPEEVIIHILSFLSTKECIATSVLSKRWKSIRRPDHTLHLTDYTLSKETYPLFVQSVNTFISSRDVNQPLQRFHLYYSSSLLDEDHVNEWVDAAAQHRLECLMIFVSNCIYFQLSSTNPIFSCKTLSVLQLNRVQIWQLSSVYLPSLKTLRLYAFNSLDNKDFIELLAGTPNLEELELDRVFCIISSVIEPKFKRLSKLIRASITKFIHVHYTFPWEAINNVQFLRLDSMDNVYNTHLFPEFPNLTHIEFICPTTIMDWLWVFDVVKHCPKLQDLSINKMIGDEDDGKADWPYPQDVPLCISSQLKSCSLRNYEGSESEIRFARYILENARHLGTLKIYSHASDEPEKLKMLQNLTLCSKLSTTCKVSLQ